MHPNSIIGIKGVVPSTVEQILFTADSIMRFPMHYSKLLSGFTVGSLFFEPSTRTHLSFQSAVYKMDGSWLNYQHDYSSAKKGESLRDTIKTIENYCDIFIIRHPDKNSVEQCAEYTNLPVINAGNGDGEHPTQALLDLYTIKKHVSSTSFTIAFSGDAKHSRTIHSLILLLEKMNYSVKYVFITCPQLRPDIECLQLDESRCRFYDNFESIIGEIDVLYMTRLQKERHPRYKDELYTIPITDELLDLSKDDMIVLHPLPRNDEISPELDTNPKCKYFEQVRNGVFVRMAVLLYSLGLVCL